jgi:tetratricopeptide (TPR) repeat protein
VLLVIVALPAAGAAQETPIEEQLLSLEHAAAVQTATRRAEETRQALTRLQERFDKSIHSARDVPEQRKVQFDAEALDHGLRLARIFAEATSDDRPLRLFTARQQRIQGTMLLNERKPAEAVKVLSAALAEAERLGDRWLEVITRTNLAYGHLELGDEPTALAECERALKLAEATGDERSIALTLFNLASVQVHLQRFEPSLAVGARAAEFARKVGIRLWEGNALLNIGIAHRQLKRTAEARQALTQARDVLLKTQDKLGIGRAYYSLALVEADLQDYRAAVSDMEHALPIIRGTDIRHSHHIEEDPAAYYNSIEDSALQLLAAWYSKLGDQQKAQEHTRALAALRATRPAAPGGHVHGPGPH